MQQLEAHWSNINVAFSKQSSHFDDDDLSNPILQHWRQQIYEHADGFLKPNATILELNAGTGIDAIRFVKKGHYVHATDLSDGMIQTLKKKIENHSLENKISVQQISFDNLNQVDGKYDFVFSNFGGLNCIKSLSKVAHEMPRLLNNGAYLTWVIMPPVCLWEWAWILKGQFRKAFRRLRKETLAHLEGEYFETYYHSLSDVRKALGPKFSLTQVEGLGTFSPPPSAATFTKSCPRLTNILNSLDYLLRRQFPFNRSGDHLIITFQFISQ
jgi:ubiquinone/menaquinone biosynthesis C-methylase UbiE